MLDNTALITRLRAIVGDHYVLTGLERTRRFRTGIRFGSGAALAVVQPASEPVLTPLSRAAIARLKIIPRLQDNPYIICGALPGIARKAPRLHR